MKPTLFLLLTCYLVCIAAHAQTDCRKQAAFVQKFGFDPSRTALSSSEKKFLGLVLIQFKDINNLSAGNTKTYQHPSWRMAGALGPIATDAFGNAYTTPIASINVLNNPTQKQNTVYKIDANTGEMALLVALPAPKYNDKMMFQNPFGAVGLGYDCDAHTLYVSSLAGSTRTQELGKIFLVNLKNNEITTLLDSIDAMGVAVCKTTGEKRLYFGKTRSSDVFSVALTDGRASGAPKFEFSLEAQGARGDDKARRIKALPNGDLQVVGIEFYYNLTAPTDKPETNYIYRYSPSKKLWLRVQ